MDEIVELIYCLFEGLWMLIVGLIGVALTAALVAGFVKLVLYALSMMS
jgi:hypothetical protein